MKNISAGILVYRFKNKGLEVFLVHPGGPIWAKKDDGVWSAPKGQVDEGEEPFEAAKREFVEETGFSLPEGEFIPLGEVIYPRGDKKVLAWAVEGDFDAAGLRSNEFEMMWPPRSGKKQKFPEIDRGGWFSLPQASRKLFAPNQVFLERLANELHIPFGPEEIPDPPAQGSLF
jgi:predicted NUDIX family NTP pyrophosphohydrolase